MRVFLHDLSFEGLLTAIYHAYYSNNKPDRIYCRNFYRENLLDEVVYIETDIAKFEKVFNAIKNKISKNSLNKIYLVFLSEYEESSNLIYAYVRMGFKLGQEVELHKNNDIVLNIDKISKKVSYEKHRFTGFVRFKEVNNVLYSAIEPDFNILPIIANHFKNRLANEYFIIHDIKRNVAIVYDTNDYYLTSLSELQKDKLLSAKDSGEYEALWKQYFKSTNIKERENPRLQSRMMPKRYRNHMMETKLDFKDFIK